VAGLGDGPVEHREMLLHFWQRRLDRRAVGAPVGGAREKIRPQILAHQQRVDMGVDERDPLLRSCAVHRVPWNQEGAVESVIDVITDRPRLAERHIAMPHDRDLAEGVDGVDFRRVRHHWDKGVRHAFFETSDTDNANVIALRCADDLKLRHGSAPLWSMSDSETTRKENRNRQRGRFFPR
jgi:hypothetical protein